MGAIVKRHANFAETEVDGEILLIDMDGGMIFAMKDTAAELWALIDGKRDLGGVVDELATRFAAEAATIRHDCSAMVDDLLAAGLVEIVKGS